MANHKTPAHIQADAAFKKQKATEVAKQGTRLYESNQAAKLANMGSLRAQRLAREAAGDQTPLTPKPKGRGVRKIRDGAQ